MLCRMQINKYLKAPPVLSEVENDKKKKTSVPLQVFSTYWHVGVSGTS